MKPKEYFVKYDIASRTQYMVDIESETVVREYKFKICPYIWFGELKKKIESGLITWVGWRRMGFID